MYLSGKSMLGIAKELTSRGVPPVNTKTWSRNTILCILTNEKYTGDMVLQKTYRPDFRAKKSKVNCGQVRKYEVKQCRRSVPGGMARTPTRICPEALLPSIFSPASLSVANVAAALPATTLLLARAITDESFGSAAATTI